MLSPLPHQPLVIISNYSFLYIQVFPMPLSYIDYIVCASEYLWSSFFKTCHYVTQEHSSSHECPFVCVLRVPDFQVEVQLDSNKHKQKGAVRRALFLDSQQPLLQRSVRVRHGDRICDNTKIYLRVCSFSSLIKTSLTVIILPVT